MGRSRDGGGSAPAAGRDERRTSRRGPRTGRGRRRPRPRAGGGLRQRPPHLPPAVARRADPPGRGRRPRRRDGPRHDGRAALVARTRPARRRARHPGRPLRRAGSSPASGPAPRRRTTPWPGCRSTTVGSTSRSPCTSCAGCSAPGRCRPGGSRSSTVPGGRTTRAGAPLGRQLGLAGRAAARRALGRRLARVGVQHLAGGVRRGTSSTRAGARPARPTRPPRCGGDDVDVGHRRPGGRASACSSTCSRRSSGATRPSSATGSASGPRGTARTCWGGTPPRAARGSTSGRSATRWPSSSASSATSSPGSTPEPIATPRATSADEARARGRRPRAGRTNRPVSASPRRRSTA